MGYYYESSTIFSQSQSRFGVYTLPETRSSLLKMLSGPPLFSGAFPASFREGNHPKNWVSQVSLPFLNRHSGDFRLCDLWNCKLNLPIASLEKVNYHVSMGSESFGSLVRHTKTLKVNHHLQVGALGFGWIWTTSTNGAVPAQMHGNPPRPLEKNGGRSCVPIATKTRQKR